MKGALAQTMRADHSANRLLSEYGREHATGTVLRRSAFWVALGAFVLLGLIASLQASSGGSDAALLDEEAALARPQRTPVPDSLYPYPEQRIGFVLFGMRDVDVSLLNAGFAKLEHRTPRPAELRLGLDFCTVIIEDTWHYEAPDPETYWAYIEQMVAEAPGHLWLIGNEPENPCRFGTHSSEYVRRYRKFYYFIKERDPTAQVGIGGVVLPSAIRRRWLEKVLDDYRATYGEPMPIDVWNIHNLLLSECPGECGCPDGSPYQELCCSGGYVPRELWPQRGWYFPQSDQARVDIFKQLIWEFRRWMATREEAQNKPLIITEMGVFAPKTDGGGDFPHDRINQFMYETFDFMMNTTDPEVGYAEDGYRLVQRWTWYKLKKDNPLNGYLFNRDGSISDFGLNFANYTAQFLPQTPTTIFFQKGWTGYNQDGDTTLRPRESSPNGNSLWISADGSQKALLKFDVSLLPADVEVVSATLSLVPNYRQGVGDMTVNCYGLERPWDVGTATWTNATDTTRWEGEGASGPGDRGELVASALVVAERETYTWDVTELARQWVADPSMNHGVVLEGSAAGSGYWTFVSSNQPENPPYGFHRLRPKLELVVQLREEPVTPTPTATPSATETPQVTETATATSTPTVSTHRLYLPIIRKEV